MADALVARPVEREPLEEPADVEEPVASPLEHFHAVVETLHKPTRLPTLEVVRDLIHPPIDRPQKAVELRKPACPHPLAPGSNRTRGPRLRVVALEQFCEVFPQVIGRFDLRRVGEHPLEQLPFLRLELHRPLAKRPHRPLELGILGLGQRSLEPLEFLLAHRVGAVAVGPRHMETVDDDLGPGHLRFDRADEAFIHIRARALDRVPKPRGYRAQKGRYRRLLAVREHRQDLDASPLERDRHQCDEIAVPALERDLVEAEHSQLLPGAPVDGALDPAVEDAVDGLLRDAELASRVRHRRVDQHAQGPWLVRFRVGASRLVPLAPWRRRGVARTVRAAIPFGPNLDEHGHVEQGQMAKAHDRIQPMQIANLPTAAAAPGPFNGALDADEPVPLLGSLCGEDANLGQVQRNLNDIFHSDSHREPGPRSSHKGAPSLYYTCSPSRQFRESQSFSYGVQLNEVLRATYY